jgi:YVTN family beta-propeller protein
MKLYPFYLAITVLLVAGISISILSCRKQKIPMPMAEKQIDYPAAYVVNGESGTISVIDLAKNNVTETIELMGADNSMIMWPHHLSLYSIFDMHRLVVGVPGKDLSEGHSGGMHDMKGKVLVIDAIKGKILKSLELPVSNHNAIYSPDGREIWVSQMEMAGKVLVFDAQTYALKNTIPVGMEPAEVTFSADGSKAYVANGGDNSISVINPVSKNIITTIAVGAEPVAAWVGYDGKMYVDNEAGKTISVIDVAGNSVVQTIDLGFMPGSVAHNAAKKELWVTDPENSKVHYWTWNQSANQWVHGGAFNAGAGSHAIAFTGDGNTAYVTNQMAGSVSVINVSGHSKIKDITVGKKPNGIVLKQ